jgi:surface polysaccharide O-acyltransferase-like enzyme
MRERRSNLSIELLRIVAAASIVFIHVVLPGEVGNAARGMARFAVPAFLMISGFFGYGVSDERLRMRARRTLTLVLASSLLYCLWGCVLAKVAWGSGPRAYLAETLGFSSVVRWLFLGENPFSEHLWYLSALLYVYLILIALRFIVRGGMQRRDSDAELGFSVLVTLAASGLLFTFFCDLFAIAYEMDVNLRIYRNVLGMGLPFYVMGMALRRAEKRWGDAAPDTAPGAADAASNAEGPFGESSKRRYLALACLGIALSAVQVVGIRKAELPVGALVAAWSLVALCVRWPVPESPLLRRLAGLPLADTSLALYIVHPLIADGMRFAGSHFPVLAPLAGPWVLPFATLAISLLVGMAYGLAMSRLRRR